MEDPHQIPIEQDPSIDIQKTPDFQKLALGAVASFTLTVTNTGNVTLHNVVVTDPTADNPPGVVCPSTTLTVAPDPGSSMVCTAQRTVTQDLINVATATGEPTVGPPVSDTDTAEVDALPVISLTKTASVNNVVAPGENVTFTIVISNLSGPGDPVTITSLVDDVHGDLFDAFNPDISSNTCVPTTILPGTSYTCSFVAFVGVESGLTGSERDEVTAMGADDEGNPAMASDDETVFISPPIAVTNSALCIFDMDPTTEIREWRRLFTPGLPNHKLTATNPGQFFFNLSVSGTAGDSVTVAVELPWSFVTQGARPIHVYDSVTFTTNDQGETCFVPGTTTAAIDNFVTLANYNVAPSKTGYVGGVPVTYTATFDITIPPTGFAYINQHLDDGLKGRHVDIDGDGIPERYLKGGNEDGLDPADQVTVLIPEMVEHVFGTSDCSPAPCAPGPIAVGDTDSITNDNVWKRNPGAGGNLQYTGGDRPAQHIMVELVHPEKGVVGRGRTDEDGYYENIWKQKGKPTDYTVRLSPDATYNLGCTLSRVIKLRGNGFAEVSFSDTQESEDLPAVEATCIPAPQGGFGDSEGPGSF